MVLRSNFKAGSKQYRNLLAITLVVLEASAIALRRRISNSSGMYSLQRYIRLVDADQWLLCRFTEWGFVTARTTSTCGRGLPILSSILRRYCDYEIYYCMSRSEYADADVNRNHE